VGGCCFGASEVAAGRDSTGAWWSNGLGDAGGQGRHDGNLVGRVVDDGHERGVCLGMASLASLFAAARARAVGEHEIIIVSGDGLRQFRGAGMVNIVCGPALGGTGGCGGCTLDGVGKRDLQGARR